MDAPATARGSSNVSSFTVAQAITIGPMEVQVRRSRRAHREVVRGGVALSIRDNGREAPAVVLLTGIGTPQGAWDRVVAQLDDRYRIITFDYRGHGRSSAAPDYSFDAFLGDLRAVVENTSPRDPLLCGWSFGADLAIWYGADHPQTISGVIALDGGIPAEPMRLDEDQLRRQRDGAVGRATRRLMRMLGAGVHLTTDELVALIHDTHRRRTKILEAYRRLDVPVSVALGSRPTRSPDGDRSFEAWRAGAEQLVAAQPAVDVTWLDSDHAIPLRKPDEVVALVDAAALRGRGTS
ncbi:MAG: alpha/beta fold hydrolase [Pseudonocardiaceae bacterium]|nr:alpha/beta fold hydrolase [Pseudonocardiaceae bacterium]